jgi:hypothetical protein
MKNAFVRFLCCLLVLSTFALPFNARAGLIGTEQIASAVQNQAARDTVRNFVNRADASTRLQALGLDSTTANDRINAMTDSEVATLADRINSLPAGGDAAGLLILILIVAGIYFLAVRR